MDKHADRRDAQRRKARYGVRVHNHAALERLANEKAKAQQQQEKKDA